jgi:autotransporter-associated beta strand protein
MKTLNLSIKMIMIALAILMASKANAQLTYWNGNQTYTSNTTISGELRIAINSLDLNISPGVTVTVNATITTESAYPFPTITKKNGGSFTIAGPNSGFQGRIVIDDGTVQLGTGGSGALMNASLLQINNNGTLRFNPGSSSVTYATTNINGAGKIIYTANAGGKLTVSNHNNTFSGTTTLEGAGILSLGHDTATESKWGGDIVMSNAGVRVEFNRSIDFEFSGAISGIGNVIKKNSNKLTLTGANTYSGPTTVESGTLRLGNSTSAGNAAIYSCNSDINLSTSSTTLLFDAGGGGTLFSKNISGAGKVEFQSPSSGRIDVIGNNTYTGTTTVLSGGLGIGNMGTTGTIPGNVTLSTSNSSIQFRRTGNFTFPYNISGAGAVNTHYGTTTLSGTLTYTGETRVNSGSTLILGGGSNIANSSDVTVDGKLDISIGPKTIKGLNGSGEVALGNMMLTLGTDDLSNDGGGNFTGRFTTHDSGGDVFKQGTRTFTMSGTSTAKGDFVNYRGAIVLNNATWAGNFVKSSSVPLTVTGECKFGRFAMQGGTTYMNLSGATPSKLTVTGAVTQSGTVSTLNITAIGSASNYTLIQAASGIPNTTNYAVTGATGTLSANGTQLIFTPGAATSPPVITTPAGALAAGTVGSTYNVTLAATNAPTSWTVASGSLPGGLSLNTSGVISGQPTALGTFNFGVRATNSGGTSAVVNFSITVNPAASTPPVITTPAGALAAGTVGSAYNVTLAATNSPTSWTVASGSLPGGLSLNNSGVISGQPTAAGTFNFGVTATNSHGTSATVSFSIVISPASATAPAITTPAGELPEGTIGSSYSVTLSATNSPTSWAVSGSLPGGLSLNNSGVISGLPTDAGTFTFSVTASNSGGTSSAVTFSITINSFVAVTGITGVPTEVAVGVPLDLWGTVMPENATNQDIVWSIQSAGTTGATIFGNTLFTNTLGTVVVTARITNGLAIGSHYTTNFDIVVKTSTGLKDIASPVVRAYPNPTTGQLTIEDLQFTIENIEVFDLYGKKMVNCKSSIANTIDISHLPAGIYLLRIDSGNKQTTLKIVKK